MIDKKNFRNWLIEQGLSNKVASDTISRLKRIEREIDDCDIEEQYHKDKCQYLLKVFAKTGLNDEMKKYPNTTFPIGKYYMGTYRVSLKKYIRFKQSKSKK